jgi:hypothetical protein
MDNAKLNLQQLRTWALKAWQKILCERAKTLSMQQNTWLTKEARRRIGEMQLLHTMLEESSKALSTLIKSKK